MSALGIFAVACGGGGGGGGGGLAAKQILHFPVFQDPKTWDPGKLDAEVDSELVQNVFDNLWRYDNSLNIVPDIASKVPPEIGWPRHLHPAIATFTKQAVPLGASA